LIIGGNCNVCLGALAGIDASTPGIVWVDAHADFRPPDTNASGFFDGTDLALATGACREILAGSIPKLRPVAERDTILVGVREIDARERDALDRSEMTVIAGGGGPGSLPLNELQPAVAAIARRVGTVYLHLDLDSIDVSLGARTSTRSPAGSGSRTSGP
jgi:arginase